MLSSFASMYINNNLLCALAQLKVAGELYKAFKLLLDNISSRWRGLNSTNCHIGNSTWYRHPIFRNTKLQTGRLLWSRRCQWHTSSYRWVKPRHLERMSPISNLKALYSSPATMHCTKARSTLLSIYIELNEESRFLHSVDFLNFRGDFNGGLSTHCSNAWF